jgi:hypothetical protein
MPVRKESQTLDVPAAGDGLEQVGCRGASQPAVKDFT